MKKIIPKIKKSRKPLVIDLTRPLVEMSVRETVTELIEKGKLGMLKAVEQINSTAALEYIVENAPKRYRWLRFAAVKKLVRLNKQTGTASVVDLSNHNKTIDHRLFLKNLETIIDLEETSESPSANIKARVYDKMGKIYDVGLLEHLIKTGEVLVKCAACERKDALRMREMVRTGQWHIYRWPTHM